MDSPGRIERQIRAAGLLVLLGLAVEAVCLLWAGPLAFILLIAAGFTLIGAGILLYLYSLLSHGKVMPQPQNQTMPPASPIVTSPTMMER